MGVTTPVGHSTKNSKRRSVRVGRVGLMADALMAKSAIDRRQLSAYELVGWHWTAKAAGTDSDRHRERPRSRRSVVADVARNRPPRHPVIMPRRRRRLTMRGSLATGGRVVPSFRRTTGGPFWAWEGRSARLGRGAQSSSYNDNPGPRPARLPQSGRAHRGRPHPPHCGRGTAMARRGAREGARETAWESRSPAGSSWSSGRGRRSRRPPERSGRRRRRS